MWGMGTEPWGSRSSVWDNVKRRFDLEASLGVRGLGASLAGVGAGMLWTG